MPKTITTMNQYKVYTLDEMLNDPEKKTCLLKKHNLGNDDSWNELDELLKFDVDDLLSKLEELGYKDVEIHYDLSYAQGSGACFDFVGLYLDKLIDCNEAIRDLCKDNFPATLETFFSKGIQPIVKTYRNHFANHYCHEKTRYVELEGFDTPYDSIEDEITSTKDWKEFENQLQELIQVHYLDQCRYIYSELKKRLDYYQGEEYTIQDLRDNCPDAWFLEDGSIFYTREDEIIAPDGPDDSQYVIIDQDGKLLSRIEEKDSKPIFLDSIDEEDEGYSKAIKFNSEIEAYKAIAYRNGEEVHNIKTVFKKKEN